MSGVKNYSPRRNLWFLPESWFLRLLSAGKWILMSHQRPSQQEEKKKKSISLVLFLLLTLFSPVNPGMTTSCNRSKAGRGKRRQKNTGAPTKAAAKEKPQRPHPEGWAKRDKAKRDKANRRAITRHSKMCRLERSNRKTIHEVPKANGQKMQIQGGMCSY